MSFKRQAVPEKEPAVNGYEKKVPVLCKRAFLSASLSSGAKRGSLTVEAALVLPLFLFFTLTVITIAEAVRFSGNSSAALCEAAKQLSVYSYAIDKGLGGGIGSKAVSLVAGQGMAMKELGEKYVEESPVEHGSGGLSFLHSNVLNVDQMVDLVASYKIKTPFSFLGINGFKVVDRARVRAFTGYDNTRREDLSSGDDEIVFVTDYGEVYHRSRSCRHLDLNIRETNMDAVGNERNNNGAKYYPCEYCGGGSGHLYITDDGDRYHSSITCPALKRGIHAVPLSSVGGRSPCSACGH